MEDTLFGDMLLGNEFFRRGLHIFDHGAPKFAALQ